MKKIEKFVTVDSDWGAEFGVLRVESGVMVSTSLTDFDFYVVLNF